MSHSAAQIRKIELRDNPEIAKVIRSVLIEIGMPKVGTAYADKSLDEMYETYQKPKSTYFVIQDDGEVIGGAGVAQLDKYEGNVCELQKMYFLPKARGKGYGLEMIHKCIQAAKDFGYNFMYLETMPYMKDAGKLYTKLGFDRLEAPMGDTGHYSCSVWMLKKL